MKLEVGEFYLSAGGEIVKIEDKNSDTGLFLATNLQLYYEDGSYTLNKQSIYDLIEHIPSPLRYELLRVINEYHTNKDFKINVDENFNNLGNKK